MSNVSEKREVPSLILNPTTEEVEISKSASDPLNHSLLDDHARRIHTAERVLLDIAKEYAAKRAAGLVPSKPVPARTLLWEELERRAQRVRNGTCRRGTCVFGRDSTEGPCGCTSYRMTSIGSEKEERTASGGICECCHHGAPWHRLGGGTVSENTQSGYLLSQKGSKGAIRKNSSFLRHSIESLGSDYYDEYDPEYESDESDEDDAIANEVARPYLMMMRTPTPSLTQLFTRSEGMAPRRESLVSSKERFGLPPRLSSTSRQLDQLLNAIAKYRAVGFSEAAIEEKIRQDFPPTQRLPLDSVRVRATSR